MRTLPFLFESCVEKFPENKYLWEHNGIEYIGSSYSEIRSQVHRFSCGLLALGINDGDRAVLLSEGRNLWVVSELALLYIGATNVPLSVKLNEREDFIFRINHSESRFIIVSKGQLQKIRAFKDGFNTIEKIIVLDEVDDLQEDEISITEVLSKGDVFLDENKAIFDERRSKVTENHCANICYTSGTSADPKGTMLSHLNYYANVQQCKSLISIPPHFKTLLILPWDHSFAHTVGIYSFMIMGASVAAIQVGKSPMETLKNIPKNIKEIKPHVLMSVPALAKNFKNNIDAGVKAKGPKAYNLYQSALKLAYKVNKEGYNKKACPLQKLKMKIFDKILFSKIRANFGGNLQFFVGGGALLDIELQRFFYAIGMPMFQGYGLTEAAPVISSNAIHKHTLGSSGILAKDIQLKICDEEGAELETGKKGEIVVKGENVMHGYWKNKEADAEMLKNGWLHTGDLGYIDADGFLYVLGRFKSLLIGDDGEKYSPEGIEELMIAQSSLLEVGMLYNNQNAYTIGLFHPNISALNEALKRLHNSDLSQDKGQELALSLIQAEINEYKKGGKYEGTFPERWLPSAIGILPEGFTEQNRFLNSTLKMVRPRITEYYQSLIDYLYTPEGKNIVNGKNMNLLKLSYEK